MSFLNVRLVAAAACMLAGLALFGCKPPPPVDDVAPQVEFSRPSPEEIKPAANDPRMLYAFHVVEDQGLARLSVEVMGNQTMIRLDVCGGEMPPCRGEPPTYAFTYDLPLFQGTNEISIIAEDLAGNRSRLSDLLDMPVLDHGVLIPLCAEERDLLILTPEAFKAALQPLVLHKNATGTPAILITLEAIEANSAYSHGRDVQERIKLAIAAARECWDIRYVMLVGDVDRFPVRYTRTWDSVHWGHGFVPSDLYYADLYDSSGQFDDWDADNDNLFGEMNSGGPANWADLNQDSVDLHPDVAVGRIPASNPDEVQTMVNKIIAYEQGANPSWAAHVLFVSGNFSNPKPTVTQIAAQLALIGFTNTQLDETNPACGGSSLPPCSLVRTTALNNAMNSGVGFVAYFGHGYGGTPGNMDGSSGGWAGWYDYQSIATLTNSTRLPIVTAAACDTAQFHFPHQPYQQKAGGIYAPASGVPQNQQNATEPAAIQPAQYDQDSMAEHFLVKQPAGAVAYFGGYTGVQPHSFRVVQRMFDELAALGGTARLGDIWKGGVERYIVNDFGDVAGYWNNWYSAAIYHHIQKMMLFGDPSLRIGGAGQIWDLCDLHPEICDLKLLCKECLFRYLRDDIPFRILDIRDRYVIRLDEIDRIFGGSSEPWRMPGRVEVRVSSPEGGLAAEIYSDSGTLLVENSSRTVTMRLVLETEPQRRYLLVLRPVDEGQIGKLQDVEISILAR
ncbi:MAG: hypothetical protein H3C34_08915 [Caldilineaceae bacterium]|nr:hypothetical protein [Caldilineaceae bacterium]